MATPSAKIKKLNKVMFKKLIIVMSSLLVLSCVGSIVGTYSWFEYKARAGLDYHGTAVGQVSGMTIGLFSEKELVKASEYNLVKDKRINNLYWTNNNALDSDTLIYYSKVNGYAANELQPVTSGKYGLGDELRLKSAPAELSNYDPNQLATSNRYMHLPLAFKLSGNDIAGINQSVMLTNVQLDGEGYIQKGVRIYFANQADRFIFNPSKDSEGFDQVGGPLDLNLDGFYDTKINPITNRNEEYCYGEVKELIYNTTPTPENEPLPLEERSTFVSNHKGGTYAINEQTTYQQSQYLGVNDVIGKKMLGAVYASSVLRLDMDIYVEGWAPEVKDQQYKNFFDLTMEFELMETTNE